MTTTVEVDYTFFLFPFSFLKNSREKGVQKYAILMIIPIKY